MLEAILKKTNLRDVLIILIASLAIVGFWRGVWGLLDYFLFPNNFLLSQIISIFLGIFILLWLSRNGGWK
ncbi:hypothetical protein H8D91_02195 [archaeon]|nr:hypothetical protein [archaeon]